MEGRPRGGGGGGRTAMDYSLAALKLLASQLAGSTTAPSSEGSSPAQMLFGIRFQRAWIQAGRGGARGLQRRRREAVRG